MTRYTIRIACPESNGHDVLFACYSSTCVHLPSFFLSFFPFFSPPAKRSTHTHTQRNVHSSKCVVIAAAAAAVTAAAGGGTVTATVYNFRLESLERKNSG